MERTEELEGGRGKSTLNVREHLPKVDATMCMRSEFEKLYDRELSSAIFTARDILPGLFPDVLLVAHTIELTARSTDSVLT